MLQCSINTATANAAALGGTSLTVCDNPWFNLSWDAAMLGFEAQSVIGLRLIKAAVGGEAATREAALMIAEKTQAAFDAHFLLTQSALAGEPHLGPGRAVALYRRRVQANRRRLGKGG
jgi:hypothetical protein